MLIEIQAMSSVRGNTPIDSYRIGAQFGFGYECIKIYASSSVSLLCYTGFR